MFSSRMKIKPLVISLLFLVFPITANASEIFFEMAESQYSPGDTFAATIKLDIGKQCVNAGEIAVKFPADKIKFKDFSSGLSVFSLWIDIPSAADAEKINKEGIVRFSGGTPGGYCGKIPGDPGESNILGKLIFSVPAYSTLQNGEDLFKIEFLPETAIFLNDGKGTRDTIGSKPAEAAIVSTKTFNIEEWKEDLRTDTVKPEPFVVELRRDEDIFNNSYYIIFATTDKQTGVDHYEVLELASGEQLGVAPKASWLDRLLRRKKETPSWKAAESPYLLSDQDLFSTIKVKAVDKAGNETIVEYIPSDYHTAASAREKGIVYYLFGIISLLAVLSAGIVLIKRKRKSL